ncbi:MAG: pilus assembly protein PilM [Planctomycetia bacterium]|nr:pilus assembly protein PilM [Planctomycetia bacterium]
MARNEIVWGIDVGNTSLKALRCRLGEEPGAIEVLGFDFIEHSKIMSQPGADPNEILAESLSLFLSRNNIKGERIAVSVSGQNTLWRFQPLPPIDPKKVADLIRYEVKQWLPFDLSEVIWDFRQVGGVFEGGIALDLNIFMYAMKRDLAFKLIESYQANGVDIDCVQGAQIALYNAFIHDNFDYDQLVSTPPEELNDYDVLLNVGTDTTEVVVTNGVTVWLRNIPIGGNLFTKALTKSLKLTFSNAEHIKRNAATSQDPKAVILAMKPVFNDMLSEIDRSIKYYCSLNKRARIRKVYAFGNAMKLPGLRQFLAKSNELDITVVSAYRKMVGAEVLNNAVFKENASSFGVAYGLAIQLLNAAPIDINLVPREIIVDRIIDRKKPWVLAASALLILALTIQFVAATIAFSTVENAGINSAFDSAKRVAENSSRLISDTDSEVSNFKAVDQIGRNLTSNVEGRITWIELIKAINTVIPAENPSAEVLRDNVAPAQKREAIEKLNRIYINNIEVQKVEELKDWFDLAKRWYYIDSEEDAVFDPKSKISPAQYWFFPVASDTKGGEGEVSDVSASIYTGADSSASDDAASDATDEPTEETAAYDPTQALTTMVANEDPRLELIPGPSGPGNIVQLSGYHYHNTDDVNDPERGAEYVRRTILFNLKHGEVKLPISLERQQTESGTETVTLRELGIYYPILINPGVIDEKFMLLDPEAAAKERAIMMEQMLKSRPGASRATRGGMGGGMEGGMMGGRNLPGLSDIASKMRQGNKDKILNLRRFDFIVQFVWQETPPSVRDARRKAIAEAKAAAEAENADAAGLDENNSDELSSELDSGTTSTTESEMNESESDLATSDSETAEPATSVPANEPAAEEPATPEEPATNESAAEQPEAEGEEANSDANSPEEQTPPDSSEEPSA